MNNELNNNNFNNGQQMNNQSTINQMNNGQTILNNNMTQYQQNNNQYGVNDINQQFNNNVMGNNNQPLQSQFNNNVQPNISINNTNKKNKKTFFIIGGIVLAIILTISILFLVLFRDKNYSRTIMIYMVGSNLESESGLGTVDLNSINYNNMDNKNINVVLIAGGSERWDNNYIDENETSIYELTASGYKKVKTQDIQNMGDSKVFSNYLNYVYENYKTDKYDLIFWNHGGAIYGSEFDDLSGDNLTLEEMRVGLSNSNFNKNNKLETVIFRTCLNGTIEIADTFKDYSDYLVASEEITLGSSITGVLNFINDIEPNDTGTDVGIKFVNSYKEQISKLKNYYGSSEYIYSTYSVVDLSKIEKLVESLNSFVDDINVSENYNKIAKTRSNLYQYAYTQSSDPTYDTVDLYNLVNNLEDLSLDKANVVLNNLESAIVYNWATNNKSRGMSIYFPYNGSNDIKKYFLNVYKSLNSFSSYNNFISNFYLVQTNQTRAYSFNSNKTNIKTTNNKSDFSLELTDEQLEGYARAEYLVFMDKGEGYYWPVYKGKEVTLDGNTLNASINGTHLKVKNETGDFVIPLFETYNEDDYIKYSTNVVLEDLSSDNPSEWKMDSAELSLVLDRKSKKVKVGSVILNKKDKNKPSTVAVNLKDYQYIAFGSMSHKILDENGNFSWDVYNNSSNGIFEGVEITPDELSELKLSNFGDENDYFCVFRIYDVNNNYYYSKLIKMN